jgi:predicted transposase YbfD/YdcC
LATFSPLDTKNQPTALPDDIKTAETTEKGHGRLEIRRAMVSAEVVPHIEWPGAAQVVRIERTREIRGKTTTEIAYFVTSLTAAEAGPARLLALNRQHWGIENTLHWRRDVSMSEDRSPGRACARVMAGLRNTVLALLHGSKVSIPAARETFAANQTSAVQAVMGGIL